MYPVTSTSPFAHYDPPADYARVILQQKGATRRDNYAYYLHKLRMANYLYIFYLILLRKHATQKQSFRKRGRWYTL